LGKKFVYYTMRILLCNKFYYRRGGGGIATMAVEELLKGALA